MEDSSRCGAHWKSVFTEILHYQEDESRKCKVQGDKAY